MTVPHGLKRILLNLARAKDFPEGSARHGYELVVPLTETGRIDPKAWSAQREVCRVRRFREGEEDLRGLIVHRAGGANGGTWFFDYDITRDDDDDVGFRLGDHLFVPGDYVSIRHDGEMHTFHVISVVDA
jgi:hypothetical protein